MKRIIWGVVAIVCLLWSIKFIIYPQTEWNVWIIRDEIVLFTGIFSYTFMTLIMLLAIRPKWLEDFFGGLDKMYYIHKWAGILSILIGGLHYFVDYIGPNFLESIFGDHHKEHIPIKDLAGLMGEYAFWAFVILATASLWKKISYHIWWYSHKLMSLAYLAIVFHTVILTPIYFWWQPVGVYVGLCSLIGAISALISLFGLIGKRNTFKGKIIRLDKLSSDIIQITCKLEVKWKHKAGQYVFLKIGNNNEIHPFTIASADNGNNELKICIKALGDYTKKIKNEIKLDDDISVEGPYGKFNFMLRSSKKQIWIGAGIGVTPFIAWLEALQNHPQKNDFTIDLYYSVNNKEEAVFAEQLQALSNPMPNVNLILYYSDEYGFLTSNKLNIDKDKYPAIWFCGPNIFSKALKNGLKNQNIPLSIFHQELFEMR